MRGHELAQHPMNALGLCALAFLCLVGYVVWKAPDQAVKTIITLVWVGMAVLTIGSFISEVASRSAH